MSHRHLDALRTDLKVAVIVCSDRASRGEYEDRVIPTAREVLDQIGWELSFEAIVPDEIEAIVSAIKRALDTGVDVVFTSGGTGVGPRDVTPEASSRFFQREVPGIAELMRMKSLEKTPHAALSRAKAGVTSSGTFIINLPGSPKAVRELIPILKPILIHGVNIAKGRKIE